MFSFFVGLLRRHELRTAHDDSGSASGSAGQVAIDPPTTVHDTANLALSLWREGRAETNPYRRDSLFERVATLVIKENGDALVRYCIPLVGGDPRRAEDVAQRACLTFWQILSRFEGRSSLKTFLYSVAQRVAAQDRRDTSRARNRARSVEQALQDDLAELEGELGAAPDEAADRRIRADLLAAALTRMSKRDEREAWVVRMRLVEQLTYAEILPLFSSRFGDAITTQEGLRTAFFNGKKRLLELLGATLELSSPTVRSTP